MAAFRAYPRAWALEPHGGVQSQLDPHCLHSFSVPQCSHLENGDWDPVHCRWPLEEEMKCIARVPGTQWVLGK